MTDLEEKIMLLLCKHPGARKREIAGYLQIWHLSDSFVTAWNNLHRDGIIRYETFSDPANMEWYDMWYVVAP